MRKLQLRLIAYSLLALVVVLSACAKHEDLPPMLPVSAPPLPTNFTVTSADAITFDLSWSVDDPASAAYWNVWLVDPLTLQPGLLDSTSVTNVTINLGVSLPGAVFGVSTISVENLESEIVFARSEPSPVAARRDP